MSHDPHPIRPWLRRDVLRLALAGGASALLPSSLAAAAPNGLQPLLSPGRVLVLVELEGGNDGLNTIVPYQDATYIARRPSLRLRTDHGDARLKVQTLASWGGPAGGGLGVHPALAPLKPAWQAGQLAVVHGLGYVNPNRSHFRGIDIWNGGATDDQAPVATGWLGRLLAAEAPAVAAHAVVLERAGFHPVVHGDLRILAMDQPSEFLDRTEDLVAPTQGQIDAATPALQHLLTTQRTAAELRAALAAAVATPPTFTTVFPTTEIGTQAKHVAQCIAGGFNAPVYKLALGSFDTHADQVQRHHDLLGELATALAALRSALIEKGRWNDVLVATYAEFGRRVEENDSAGTDHGTACLQFLLGGRVVGGQHGTMPALGDLDSRGDLKFNLDFRRYWATGARWLGFTDAQIKTALNPFGENLDYPMLAAVTL
jgi:uncharacterized protein (DUF1501 family)